MTTLKEQLAIGIDALRPNAFWSSCDTYIQLVETWEDPSPVPSQEEIIQAFVASRRSALTQKALEVFSTFAESPIAVTLQGGPRLVPADSATLANLLGELSAMSPEDTADWRLADLSRVTLTQSDLVTIRDAIRTRTKALSTEVNDLVDSLVGGSRPTQELAEKFGLNYAEVEEVTQ